MDDLFKEARDEAIKKALEKNVPENKALIESKLPENTLSVIKERIEEGETQWDLLSKMINGSLTEKFIEILLNMPDRDYARNYLKLLEHFKPKMTRIEGDELESPDMTINVQTVIINKNGEKEVIKIEDI